MGMALEVNEASGQGSHTKYVPRGLETPLNGGVRKLVER
jgi:hypothetical protein